MWMMRIFTTDSSSVPKWVGTFRRNKDNTSTAGCFFFSAVSWESVTCFLLFRFVHFFIFLVGGEVVSSRTSGTLTKWCTPADNKRDDDGGVHPHTHSRTHSTNPFVIFFTKMGREKAAVSGLLLLLVRWKEAWRNKRIKIFQFGTGGHFLSRKNIRNRTIRKEGNSSRIEVWFV